MTKKWKHKKQSRPRSGPTRGKYRQMWKVQIREMIPGEEETQCDEVIPASGAGRYREPRAA